MAKKYSSSHPDPIDKLVGSNIRQLRTIHGISQEKMAEELGITFQQIQKYENGSNRVGASRLYKIAQILKTSVSQMYKGIEEKKAPKLQVAEEKSDIDDIFNKRETITLLRHYYTIEDDKTRQKIQKMVKSFSQNT